MTAIELANVLSLKVLCCPDEDKPVTGGHCGDLLSYVMGRAGSGDAWVTIMTNINVVAVASLTDSGCVILAEDSQPEDMVLQRAKAQGVNLFSSPLSSFELCAKIHAVLS